MVERAQRDGRTRVAIVPTGLAYTWVRGKTWQACVRFGPALFLKDFASNDEALHTVEERVQALSSAPPSTVLPEEPGETHCS
jgi:putative membrane protein